MRTSKWPLLVAGLLVVFGLPLVGKWARRTSEPRCAFDGAKVDHHYRVRIVDDQDRNHEFCCIHCASLWLSHQGPRPRKIFVTDETTGQEINAALAWYVRSMVVTVPHTGNRIHAFREHADATRHATTAQGMIFLDSEKPFGGAAEERATGPQ